MDNHHKSNKSIYFLMLLVPLFWGGSFSTAAHVISEIPPLVAATIRFALAGIILTIIICVRKKWDLSIWKKNWKGLLLISLTGIFGYNALFFWALHYTSAINGSLIIATMPLFVSIGAILLFGEPWSGKLGFSLMFSLLGVFVVITRGSFNSLLSLSFNLGDLLFLAALFCGVAYSLVGKKVIRDASPLFTTAIMTLLGSCFLAISSLPSGGWDKVPYMSVQSWFEMGYMVIGGTLIGYVIFNLGVQRIGASQASIYLNLTPIVTSLLSVLLYDADMTWSLLLGLAFVLTGVCLANISIRKKAEGKSPASVKS
ncbi:DMT family transporter [Paenibacillus donghaensis]|uniref:DMT family transporter n=1 Tax=Paenibacillus donghaensis TaxID=414771 RepID=UPI001883C4BC|nr:DMT family transporter [Paenibacillus donghaensis]MBE9917926.1 DMT family transporter [Paenibacillus donghaensis]